MHREKDLKADFQDALHIAMEIMPIAIKHNYSSVFMAFDMIKQWTLTMLENKDEFRQWSQSLSRNDKEDQN